MYIYPSNWILAGLPLIDFQCALPPPNQNLLWILISQLVKVTSHASKGVTAHWWGGEKMQQFPFSRNATSRVLILLSILPTHNFFRNEDLSGCQLWCLLLYWNRIKISQSSISYLYPPSSAHQNYLIFFVWRVGCEDWSKSVTYSLQIKFQLFTQPCQTQQGEDCQMK